jgi:hypothetical protein
MLLLLFALAEARLRRLNPAHPPEAALLSQLQALQPEPELERRSFLQEVKKAQRLEKQDRWDACKKKYDDAAELATGQKQQTARDGSARCAQKSADAKLSAATALTHTTQACFDALITENACTNIVMIVEGSPESRRRANTEQTLATFSAFEDCTVVAVAAKTCHDAFGMCDADSDVEKLQRKTLSELPANPACKFAEDSGAYVDIFDWTSKLLRLFSAHDSALKIFVQLSSHGSPTFDTRMGSKFFSKSDGANRPDGRVTQQQFQDEWITPMCGKAHHLFVLWNSCFSGGMDAVPKQSVHVAEGLRRLKALDSAPWDKGEWIDLAQHAETKWQQKTLGDFRVSEKDDKANSLGCSDAGHKNVVVITGSFPGISTRSTEEGAPLHLAFRQVLTSPRNAGFTLKNLKERLLGKLAQGLAQDPEAEKERKE